MKNEDDSHSSALWIVVYVIDIGRIEHSHFRQSPLFSPSHDCPPQQSLQCTDKTPCSETRSDNLINTRPYNPYHYPAMVDSMATQIFRACRIEKDVEFRGVREDKLVQNCKGCWDIVKASQARLLISVPKACTRYDIDLTSSNRSASSACTVCCTDSTSSNSICTTSSTYTASFTDSTSSNGTTSSACTVYCTDSTSSNCTASSAYASSSTMLNERDIGSAIPRSWPRLETEQQRAFPTPYNMGHWSPIQADALELPSGPIAQP
ncbi:hypothetical protein B0H66DRAFT_140902 [Apodospora peruviana]|uniref:Uncharacterized protein n=1 Tax=Apodospora peruviana TaxID=516989 RepID=A0AAE0IJ12_9PEZI|nr:hypothetical protein B0H66DRAFT_140902 [Apodospora peruviana]